jgi:hypothetical protein
MIRALLWSFWWMNKSEPQGAATTLYCAFGPIEPGAYYSDCNLETPNHPDYTPEVAAV